MHVVIDPPRLDLAPRIFDRQELIGVQAFVAELAVERFDKPVLRRLSGSDEVERDDGEAKVLPMFTSTWVRRGAVWTSTS